MARLDKRLSELERKAIGPGKFVSIFKNDWRDDETETEEEWEARYAKAKEEAGPNGTVIVIAYVDDWRNPDPDAQHIELKWDDRDI